MNFQNLVKNSHPGQERLPLTADSEVVQLYNPLVMNINLAPLAVSIVHQMVSFPSAEQPLTYTKSRRVDRKRCLKRKELEKNVRFGKVST